MRVGVLFLGVVLLLAGCGRAASPEERAEFAPYLQRFSEYSKQFGRSIRAESEVTVIFAPLPSRHLGVCQEGFWQTPRVEINRTTWELANESSREILVFHELGHCLLGRGHLDNQVAVASLDRGSSVLIPVSLMSSHALSSAIYDDYKSYYLDELFRGK